MNNDFFQNTVRFFLLILLQVIVFNNMYIFGYINPYPYILFIILFPVNNNRYGLLLWSFLLGLMLDMFGDSGGIHTAACLVLAYFRHNLLRISFGLSYEYQTIKIQYSPLKEQIIFIGLSVLVHHSVLFLLEAFSFKLLGSALLKVLFSGVFTLIFSVLIINLFKPSKK